MNTVKKTMLRQLTAQILSKNNNPSELKQNLDQYYTYMLDIIDSKLFRPKTSNERQSPKHIWVINF